MPNQSDYKWLMVSALIWAQRHKRKPPDDPGGPGCGLMSAIDAVSGRLDQFEDTAANDLAVRLINLMLFLWWISAITRAKLPIRRAELCKIDEAAFFPAIGRRAALDAGPLVFLLRLTQCQFDHLPTIGANTVAEPGVYNGIATLFEVGSHG